MPWSLVAIEKMYKNGMNQANKENYVFENNFVYLGVGYTEVIP